MLESTSLLSFWSTQLRQASFKSVPFKVDVSDFNTGRRNAIHEYPQKETAYAEDMGRSSRELRIEGWVIGEDYLVQRDALLTACESPGVGQLIHPHFGLRQVACTAINVRQSSNEGRMARLAMTFVESGEEMFPAAILDSVVQLASMVDQLIHLQQDSFHATFLSHPDLETYSQVTSLSNGLATDIQKLPIQLPPEANAGFTRTLQNLTEPPTEYWQDPSLFSTAIVQSISMIKQGRSSLEQAIKDYFAFFTFGESYPFSSDDYSAFIELVQMVALAEAIKSAGEANFQFLDDAITVRNRLIEEVDRRLARTSDTTLFSVLQDLRTLLIFSVPVDSTLPNQMQYTPNTTLPSLVLSYQVYADASRADDILKYNRTLRPGFISGGYPLKLPSH